jgi:Cu-processing system permease protein
MFIFITFLNPIDLARIFVLLQLDISALMGVTGAVFKQFFGTLLGAVLTLGMLSLWFIIPFILAKIHFRKRDF